jgi:hypothetical protein
VALPPSLDEVVEVVDCMATSGAGAILLMLLLVALLMGAKAEVVVAVRARRTTTRFMFSGVLTLCWWSRGKIVSPNLFLMYIF